MYLVAHQRVHNIPDFILKRELKVTRWAIERPLFTAYYPDCLPVRCLWSQWLVAGSNTPPIYIIKIIITPCKMLAKCKCVYITEVTADSFRLILLLFPVIAVVGHKLPEAGIVTKRQSSVVVI